MAKRNGLLEIRIVCANRPGILVDIMEAVESRGLAIMQNRIACHNEIVIEYLSLEVNHHSTLHSRMLEILKTSETLMQDC